MTNRSIAHVNPSPNGEGVINDLRAQGNQIHEFLNAAVDLDDKYHLKPIAGGVGSITSAMGLYEVVSGVEVFRGTLGAGFSDHSVASKALGGFRSYEPSIDVEHFLIRKDLTGRGIGAAFGNPDSPDGNYISTSKEGGLTIWHETDDDVSQQLGNPSSTSHVSAKLFAFNVTSDQVRPFGHMVKEFVGSTDVGFTDVPYDVRILDETGTEVYSDIQELDVWEVEPQPAGNPKFTLSSVGGVVTLPAPQPFPMDSLTTYRVEYRFKNIIRLKGDGSQPALLMKGKRLEYYKHDYTHGVEVYTDNFVAESGSQSRVDCTNKAITGSFHETAKSAWVGDVGISWGTNSFTLNVAGVGNVVFGNPEKGKKFLVYRHGGAVIIENADGSFHSQVGTV